VASKAIAKELIGLEKAFWQAMKDKDLDTMSGLTDFPCIVAGPQGFASVDQELMSAMMTEAPWTLRDFQLSDDIEVRRLSEDVALVAYKVHEDIDLDGKPVALDAADTSVWVRRGGRWACAMHTESLTGDPYGRDRATTES
jgi:hypothetical protein